MSKITEQQLIESANRLKAIVREGDVKAEPIATTTGTVAGAGLGWIGTDALYDWLTKKAPVTIAKLGKPGKFVALTVLPAIAAAIGNATGRSGGQFIDDLKGTRKPWNDKLGISGVSFTPDWRKLNVNYYGDASVTLDPNSGHWVVTGSGESAWHGVDERIRDTSHYLALVQQCLEAIATGRASISEPAGGWNLGSADHLKALGKVPTLRDRLIDVYDKAHPDAPFIKDALQPPYKPAAANNPPPPPEPRVTSSGWPGAQ